jgi:hypothetical protein
MKNTSYVCVLFFTVSFLGAIGCAHHHPTTGTTRLRSEGDEDFWRRVLTFFSDSQTTRASPSDSVQQSPTYQRFLSETERRLRKSRAFLERVRTSLLFGEAELRLFCLVEITRARSNDCEDCIILSFTDPSPMIRRFALAAAGQLKIRAATPYMGIFLGSSDPTERHRALAVIRILLNKQGLPYYISLLDDPDPHVATSAAYACRDCPQEHILPHYLRFLKRYRADDSRTPILRAIIWNLRSHWGEFSDQDFNVHKESEKWIERLETYCQQRMFR